MRKSAFLVCITLALGFALAGCTAPEEEDEDGGEEANVDMKNTLFVPDELTVTVGTTVVWHNSDGYFHTVTSDEGDELDSGNINAGEEYEHTFTAPGTYKYHCEPHSYQQDGEYQSMVGTIIVTAAGNSTA